MGLGALLDDVLGRDLPVAVEAYDGTRLGPDDAPATLRIRSADALRRILTAPGELGVGRAYVAGDIEVEGDVFAALELQERLPEIRLTPRQLAAVARIVGPAGLRPLPPPPEEARLRGRRHSRARDAAAIAHHYDVSNRFYELVLGPAMTYSCAVFTSPDGTLEQAQADKHELVCRKLGLRPGMRLLDVGCGWGSLARHAARHHGASVLGVTLSAEQARWAAKAVADEGLRHLVEIRCVDYRDVGGESFDAISSIGMFEHVGLDRLGEYFGHLYPMLRPGGRLLNHGIARPPFRPNRFRRPRTFTDRYVFPDGDLHEVGSVVSAAQRAGFEARHLENLREHYELTLRRWVANIEAAWDEAVSEVGPARARIWRLYMAASARMFADGRAQVHQLLAVRPTGGASGLALRPGWEVSGRAEPR